MFNVTPDPIAKHEIPSHRPRLRRWNAIREMIELVLLIAAIAILVNLVTVRFIVLGASMEPTFFNEQFVLVSRVNYLFGEPERGDIVVFHFPAQQEQDYIKRLIGLPGDTIEFKEMQLFINGALQDEPYINEPCSRTNCPNVVYVMGEDEYFLLGDNRNRSSDSRDFARNNQHVRREHIVGEVVIRYFPPSDWGLVHKIGYP